MINILGTYECKADSKGRIMLPAPLKKQISSVLKEGFVIKRSVFNRFGNTSYVRMEENC